MELETKFDIGDKVFFISRDRVRSAKVEKIEIVKTLNNFYEHYSSHWYNGKYRYILSSENVYSSLDELCEAIKKGEV